MKTKQKYLQRDLSQTLVVRCFEPNLKELFCSLKKIQFLQIGKQHVDLEVQSLSCWQCDGGGRRDDLSVVETHFFQSFLVQTVMNHGEKSA